MRRASGVPGFALKGPTQDLFAFIYSELQHWSSSSKGNRDTREGTKLFGIGVKVREATFSQTEVLVEAIVPLLSPPLQSQPAGTTSVSPSTWLMLLDLLL